MFLPLDGALNKLYQAVADYEHVMHLMKRGGLSRNHPEYQNIKNTHIWILHQVKENTKLTKAIQFYKVGSFLLIQLYHSFWVIMIFPVMQATKWQ